MTIVFTAIAFTQRASEYFVSSLQKRPNFVLKVSKPIGLAYTAANFCASQISRELILLQKTVQAGVEHVLQKAEQIGLEHIQIQETEQIGREHVLSKKTIQAGIEYVLLQESSPADTEHLSLQETAQADIEHFSLEEITQADNEHVSLEEITQDDNEHVSLEGTAQADIEHVPLQETSQTGTDFLARTDQPPVNTPEPKAEPKEEVFSKEQKVEDIRIIRNTIMENAARESKLRNMTKKEREEFLETERKALWEEMAILNKELKRKMKEPWYKLQMAENAKKANKGRQRKVRHTKDHDSTGHDSAGGCKICEISCR